MRLAGGEGEVRGFGESATGRVTFRPPPSLLSQINCNLLLLAASFRCFEGVDLRLLLTLRVPLGVCGKVAVIGFPFDGRIGIAAAVLARWQLHNLLASIALIHNGMARPAVETATHFRHEGAVQTRLHRCTNHDNHLQF
jgi:hypothetical protein